MARTSKKQVLKSRYGHVFGKFESEQSVVSTGSARTREGKVMTMRLLRRASNPGTEKQAGQRKKFHLASAYAKRMGQWLSLNNILNFESGLVRYHLAMSLLLKNSNSDMMLSLPQKWRNGALHFPRQISFTQNPGALTYDMRYSTELGHNGLGSDRLWVFQLPASLNELPRVGFERYEILEGARSAGSGTITNFFTGTTGNNFFGVYLSQEFNQGIDGLLSPIFYFKG